MRDLYLNQEALMLLAQICILTYWLYFVKIPNQSILTRQFTKLTRSVVAVLITICYALLLPRPHPLLDRAELWMFVAALCCIHRILQLLYTYPTPTSPFPQELARMTWISRAIVGLILLLAVIVSARGSTSEITRLAQLIGQVALFYIIGAVAILIRRFYHARRQPQPAIVISGDQTILSWSGTLGFIVTLSLIALPILNNLFRGISYLPTFVERIDVFIITGAISLIGILVISRIPEPISIMVKLVWIGLLAVVLMWASLILLLSPTIEQAYQPPHLIESHQRYRLTPDTQGAYTLTAQPYRFDETWGEALNLIDEQSALPLLPFSFPFYDHAYQRLFVAAGGFITLGEPPSFRIISAQKQPTIAPLYMNVNIKQGGTIFYKSRPDKVTITWQAIPEALTGAPNTFQVQLQRNGVIEFAYAEINPRPPDGSINASGLWLIGILPGNGTPLPDQVRFTQSVSQKGEPLSALIENSDLDFRHYLHRRMIPVALALFGVMALVLISFPLIFRITLIAPLRALLAGVEEVDRGNWQIVLTPTFNDEIGTVTRSFNQMAQSIHTSREALHHLNQTLERRVSERTAELAQAKETAESANQAKSIFLATMSHELRTPLNAILGYAQLLQEGHALEKGARIIEQSGNHLLTLINDLLDIARIEVGRVDLNPIWLQLPQFLQELEALIAMRAENKGLVFQISSAPTLPQQIFVDESRLRQVLINLIDNAIKFTENGSVTLQVLPAEVALAPPTAACDEQVGTKPSDQEAVKLQFTVIDTGIGIADEDQPRIFQPFEQIVGNQQAANSTGLGLAVSRHLVGLMGGVLVVESQLGHGSRFTMTIAIPARVRAGMAMDLPTTTDKESPIHKLVVARPKDHTASPRSVADSPAGHHLATITPDGAYATPIQQPLLTPAKPIPRRVLVPQNNRKTTDPAATEPDAPRARLEHQLTTATGNERVDLLNALSLLLCTDDLAAAETYGQEALALATDTTYRSGQAISYIRLGNIYGNQGMTERALTHYDAALAMFEELSDQTNVADTWNKIAVVHQKQGNYPQALAFYQKASTLFERFNKHADLSRVLNNMAVLYKLQGDHEIALSLYKRTLGLKQMGANQLSIAHTLNNLGNLYREMNAPEQALPYLAQAEAILRTSPNRRNWSLSLNNIAWCYLRLGEIEKAEQRLHAVLPIHETLQHHEGKLRALLLLAEAALQKQQYGQAIEQATAALAIAEGTAAKLEARDAHQLLATAHAHTDTYQAAYAHHQQFHTIDHDIFNYQKGLQIAQVRNQYATEIAQKEAEIYRLQTEELSQAKEAAEAANQSKSYFLATISHELRTPLNAILGYTDLLQKGHALDKGLQIIEQSGQHLLSLLNDLLDMAKIEAGKLTLEPAWFSLSPFLQQLQAMIQLRADAKGLAFQSISDPALPPTVYGDQRRLRQVLINLLDNAIKFTEAGAVTLTISHQDLGQGSLASPGKSALTFAVADTGIGIAAAEFSTLFQPFTRIYPADRAAPGTGLGLAISHHLIDLMGGLLTVESEAGQGSTFTFTLTVPSDRSVGTPLPSPQVPDVAEQMPTILVVDDNENNRTLLVDFLEPLGFVVIEAVNAEEALELINLYQPPIALIDLVMPVVDGFALIEQLRAAPTLQQLLIIAISASAFAEDKERALQFGANAFLPKPFSTAQLLKVLNLQPKQILVEEEQLPHKIHRAQTQPDSTIAEAKGTEVIAHQSLDQIFALLHAAQQGDIHAINMQLQQWGEHDDPALCRLCTELHPLVQNFQIRQLVERLTLLANADDASEAQGEV